jgi:hypothetical protein
LELDQVGKKSEVCGGLARRAIKHGPSNSDYAHAVEQRRDAFMLSGAAQDGESLANAYAQGGADAYWRKRIELAQRLPAASALDLAILCARQGDRDGALRSLERAYQEHSPWLNFMACEPAFDSLRVDPRFLELLRRVGLAK